MCMTEKQAPGNTTFFDSKVGGGHSARIQSVTSGNYGDRAAVRGDGGSVGSAGVRGYAYRGESIVHGRKKQPFILTG